MSTDTGAVPSTIPVARREVAVAAPRTGVTRVGDVDKTTATVPVLDVTPVPPFATGKVPVIPVVNGSPVRLVKTPEVGVPNKGVTKVGLVARTTDPVPVTVSVKFVQAMAFPLASLQRPLEAVKPPRVMVVIELVASKIFEVFSFRR